MKEAFTYMFKDNKFWLKGLIYLCLIFIANLLLNYAQTLLPPCPKCAPPPSWNYWVCFISGTILNLIPVGYMFSCVKTIIDSEDTPVLPYINPFGDLLKGLKYTIAMLIFLLPLLVITIIIEFGISAILQGTLAGLICTRVFLLAVIIFTASIFMGYNNMFARENSLLTFYKFKQLFSGIGSGKKRYFVNLGMLFVVFFLNMTLEMGFGRAAALANLDTFAGLITVGLLSAITGTYAIFIICHLTARSIENKETV